MQDSIKTPKLNNPVCGACKLMFLFVGTAISLSNVFRLSPSFSFAPFPTGAFLGSINPHETVPNADSASMGGISKQWGRLDVWI